MNNNRTLLWSDVTDEQVYNVPLTQAISRAVYNQMKRVSSINRDLIEQTGIMP